MKTPGTNLHSATHLRSHPSHRASGLSPVSSSHSAFCLLPSASNSFSLIELIAVLALAALIAGLAAVSLRPLAGPAQISAVVSRLIAYDADSRALARLRSQDLLLHITPDSVQTSPARRGRFSDQSLASPDRPALKIPALYELHLHSPTPDLIVSSDGRTATYAVQIIGPEKESRWLLFAGLTGQCTQLPDAPETPTTIDAILHPFNPRDDAH